MGIAILVLYLNRLTGLSLADFVLELNGFMLDVVLFGVLIVWLNKRREKSFRIQNYLEQLEDFRYWKSDEGVNRKVGILRRLQKLHHALPVLNRYELPGAYLKDADFRQAQVSQTNLSQAFLLNADLSGAQLEESVFEKAYLENARFVDAKLRNCYLGWVDLRSADLSRADLRCCNLELAILWNANLREANLEGANLEKADLTQCDLAQAFCMNARFGQANLAQANLEGADLRAADLRQAQNLSADQISNAIIDENTQLPPEFDRSALLARNDRPTSTRKSSFSGPVPSYRHRPKATSYQVTQSL